MTTRAFAAASVRNASPIAGVLATEFRDCRTVFEIGSGTGQHAVHFAAENPHLTWQTSDLEPNHADIREWMRHAELPNVREPIEFDVLTVQTLPDACDAVYSSNTAHIMSFDAVARMFTLVARMLMPGGVFCLYGPFSCGGRFNTASNEEFDRTLRARNPKMGIRDLNDLDQLARSGGMKRTRTYAMPANNLIVVWHKRSETA